MERDELEDLIRNQTMDTTEVIQHLGITRQRLYAIKDLRQIKKGIYLRYDVEKRKKKQYTLREKYGHI